MRGLPGLSCAAALGAVVVWMGLAACEGAVFEEGAGSAASVTGGASREHAAPAQSEPATIDGQPVESGEEPVMQEQQNLPELAEAQVMVVQPSESGTFRPFEEQDCQADWVSEMQAGEIPMHGESGWSASPGGERLDRHMLYSAGGGLPLARGIEALLADRITAIRESGAASGESDPKLYAFLLTTGKLGAQEMAELEGLGVRVLGDHDRHTLKIQMPCSAASALTELEYVYSAARGPAWLRVHPSIQPHLDAADSQELVLFVSVFEDEATGEVVREPMTVGSEIVERVLPKSRTAEQFAALGAEVITYDTRLWTYKVRVWSDQLAALADLDSVLFVEPEPLVAASHRESQPLSTTDIIRDKTADKWGSTTITGQIDTGLEDCHTMFQSSLWGVGWNFSGLSDPWTDEGAHGSHVAGTALGRFADYRGACPWIGSDADHRYWQTKNVDPNNYRYLINLDRAMDQMGTTWEGKLPRVVNNSWGSDSNTYGTDYLDRKADNLVFDKNQVWVFSNGNAGPDSGTVHSPGTAKNVLSVGSIRDYRDTWVGDIETSSSRGPTLDNRIKPNLCAPGRSIISSPGDACDNFEAWSGTSMAAPHVSGIAASLVHKHFLNAPPAAVRAWMEAAAMPHNFRDAMYLNDYGLGRVQNYQYFYGLDSSGNWVWNSNVPEGGYHYFDLDNLPGGMSLMKVVLTWDEPAASGGSQEAVLNDLDLWVDLNKDHNNSDGSGGEWASQSRVDNMEWVWIQNPPAGNYRFKIRGVDNRTSHNYSVAVYTVRGSYFSSLQLTASSASPYVRPNQDFTVEAKVQLPSWVAAGTRVWRDGLPSGVAASRAQTYRSGALVATYPSNDYPSVGSEWVIGDIPRNYNRSVLLTAKSSSEGVKNFAFHADATNSNPTQVDASTTVYVDGTGDNVLNLIAKTSSGGSTIARAAWQRDDDPYFAWDRPASIAPIDGYGIWMRNDSTACSRPDETVDVTVERWSAGTDSLPSGKHMFSVIARDKSSNWSPDAACFEIWVDDSPPTAGTIFINNDSAQTDTVLVALNGLFAVEPHSGLAQMRFSNDGAAWSQWEAYTTDRANWDLTAYGGAPTPGVKSVYVQYRDALNNTSAVFSDTIELVTTRCTFGETLEAPCDDSTGQNVIVAVLGSAVPGQTVTFYLDGELPRVRTVGGGGGAQATYQNLPSGPHVVTVQLPCDRVLRYDTTCLGDSPCTGREAFAFITCGADHLVTAKVKYGRPGQAVTFMIDGQLPRQRTFNSAGVAKATWQNRSSGSHSVTADLACQTTLTGDVSCP